MWTWQLILCTYGKKSIHVCFVCDVSHRFVEVIRVKRYFILCTWAGVIIFTKCISTEVFTTPSKVFTCCMYLYLSLAQWVFTISWYKYRGTRLIAHKDSYAQGKVSYNIDNFVLYIILAFAYGLVSQAPCSPSRQTLTFSKEATWTKVNVSLSASAVASR